MTALPLSPATNLLQEVSNPIAEWANPYNSLLDDAKYYQGLRTAAQE